MSLLKIFESAVVKLNEAEVPHGYILFYFNNNKIFLQAFVNYLKDSKIPYTQDGFTILTKDNEDVRETHSQFDTLYNNKKINKITKSSTPAKINNINDVDNNYIINFVEYHESIGFDGGEDYATPSDTIEHLHDVLQDLKMLSRVNPIKLYRIVAVDSEDNIDKQKLGSHWVANKEHVNDPDFRFSINIEEVGDTYWLITAEVNPNRDIDWDATLYGNLIFPQEEEITLKNRGSSAKLISVEKLPD